MNSLDLHPLARPCASRAWRRTAAVALSLTALCGPLSMAQAPASSATQSIPLVASASIQAPPLIAPTGVSAPAAAANPYGVGVVWSQGDMVSRTTLVLLALMSFLSWYVIVAKWLSQRQQTLQAQAARSAFANADSFSSGAAAVGKDSPFGAIVESALNAMRLHDRLSGQVDVGSWLSQDIVRNVATLQLRMQSGLSVLATIGSTAPFVGLFGTVWGIYHALLTIGATGQASIDKVAGPVGEALIMTALGLAVAVPAVLGFNWLVRRNRLALHNVKGFGSDLHTLLLMEIEKNQRVKPGSKTGP